MKPTSKRAWAISDIDGRNARNVTLAQYLAEVRAAKIAAERIAEANYGIRFIRPTR
jgi:hypothetical protein